MNSGFGPEVRPQGGIEWAEGPSLWTLIKFLGSIVHMSILRTLEAGKIADVLVVKGDPLADPNAPSRVRLIIHDGVNIRGERPC